MSDLKNVEKSEAFSFFQNLATSIIAAITLISTVAALLLHQQNVDLKRSFQEKESELKTKLIYLENTALNSINNTEIRAQKEIDHVSQSTQISVFRHATKEMDLLFSSEKMQNYIKESAVKTVENQIREISLSAVEPVIEKSYYQLNALSTVFDAVAQTRVGFIDGVFILNSYAQQDTNQIMKDFANRFLQSVSNDYSLGSSNRILPNDETWYNYYDNGKLNRIAKKDTLSVYKYIKERILSKELNIYDICDLISSYNNYYKYKINCLDLNSFYSLDPSKKKK